MTNKAGKALKRKRQHTLHADIVVSEGFANFIPKDDRPASHDVSHLEIIGLLWTTQHTTIQLFITLDELRQ